MFGYIRPYVPELKVKENEAFKALYCGLCHQLGRSFASWTRLTLNYDFVFLAMLYYSNKNLMPTIEKGRCAVNPLSKITVAKSDEGLVYAGDIAMIMAYYKIKDNLLDSRFPAKTGWGIMDKITRSDWQKAAERCPKENEIVREMMEQQLEVEAKNSDSIDQACQPTANCLSEILFLISADEDQKKLGYHVGRFIYLCDAMEDLQSDLKTGNYNPFVTKYMKDNSQYDLRKPLNHAKDSLMMTIGEIGRISNELEFRFFSPIIRNIIEFGMNNRVQEIFEKEGGATDESV